MKSEIDIRRVTLTYTHMHAAALSVTKSRELIAAVAKQLACGGGGATVDLSRAVWRKSSRSQGNGACVEVADLGAAVAVRDSKDKTGPVLVFTPTEWRAFVEGAKVGEFDPS